MNNDLDVLFNYIEKSPWYKKVWWNICDIYYNHLTPRCIYNTFKWLYQRCRRGFDDKELWSLDNYFYKWFYPRLKAFSEKDLMSYPESYGSLENWKNEIKKRVHQLELIQNYHYNDWEFDEAEKYLTKDEIKDLGNNSPIVPIRGYYKMNKDFLNWFSQNINNLWD